jgi:hypothetical protein
MDINDAIGKIRVAIEAEFVGCCPPCSAIVKRAVAANLFVFAAMEMTRDGQYPATMASLNALHEILGAEDFDEILKTEMNIFHAR